MIQNDRFPALSRRISRLNIMGRAVIILGGIFALVVLITSLSMDATEAKATGSIFAVLLFLISLVIAEGFFLAAESIGVFLAIEMNTRGISHTTATREKIQEAEVQFPDPNLQSAIRYTIGKFVGPILNSDLKELTTLNANRRKITILAGIEHCTNLQELYLTDNEIVDISPLNKLTNLKSLLLNDNQVLDIIPLVNNSSIGEGDEVNLRGNPLNDEAYDVHIPALQKRGVNILFDLKS